VTTLNGLGPEEVSSARRLAVSEVTFMRHGHLTQVSTSSTPRRGWAVRDTPLSGSRIGDSSSAGLRGVPDLRPAQWSKLIFNATVNSVAAVTGLPHDAHFAAEETPTDLGHLVHDLVDEGKAVAAAAGLELYEDPWEMNACPQRGSRHYLDARGRRRTDRLSGSDHQGAGAGGAVRRRRSAQTAMYRLVKARRLVGIRLTATAHSVSLRDLEPANPEEE
jgi:hypothetical protein